MQKFFNKTSFILSVALVLVLSSCRMQTSSDTELDLKKYAATLKDFPSNWVFFGENWDDDSKEYSVAYGIENNNIIGFGQTISIYPDEVQAESTFLKWKNEWFGTTKKWPGTEFTPSDPRDKYIYECLQIFSDKSIISCSLLQKHAELVTIINITLDGKAMTLSQFNDILKTLDKRMNATEETIP